MKRYARALRIGIAFIAMVYFWARIQWLSVAHLYPGQWPGDTEWFPEEFSALCLLWIWILVDLLLYKKRQWLALVWLALSSSIQFLPPIPRPQPESRWLAERAAYRGAIDTGSTFGDQHTETVRGRKLTYWRWRSWGIDNAIGILYDPKDILDPEDEEDFRSFRNTTGGVLFRVQKLEKGYYLVEHS